MDNAHIRLEESLNEDAYSTSLLSSFLTAALPTLALAALVYSVPPEFISNSTKQQNSTTQPCRMHNSQYQDCRALANN